MDEDDPVDVGGGQMDENDRGDGGDGQVDDDSGVDSGNGDGGGNGVNDSVDMKSELSDSDPAEELRDDRCYGALDYMLKRIKGYRYTAHLSNLYGCVSYAETLAARAQVQFSHDSDSNTVQLKAVFESVQHHFQAVLKKEVGSLNPSLCADWNQSLRSLPMFQREELKALLTTSDDADPVLQKCALVFSTGARAMINLHEGVVAIFLALYLWINYAMKNICDDIGFKFKDGDHFKEWLESKMGKHLSREAFRRFEFLYFHAVQAFILNFLSVLLGMPLYNIWSKLKRKFVSMRPLNINHSPKFLEGLKDLFEQNQGDYEQHIHRGYDLDKKKCRFYRLYRALFSPVHAAQEWGSFLERGGSVVNVGGAGNVNHADHDGDSVMDDVSGSSQLQSVSQQHPDESMQQSQEQEMMQNEQQQRF